MITFVIHTVPVYITSLVILFTFLFKLYLFLHSKCFRSTRRNIRLYRKRFRVRKKFVIFVLKNSKKTDILIELFLYPFEVLIWFFKHQIINRYRFARVFIVQNEQKDLSDKMREEIFKRTGKMPAANITKRVLAIDESDDQSGPEYYYFKLRYYSGYPLKPSRFLFVLPLFGAYIWYWFNYYGDPKHSAEYLEYWGAWWALYEPFFHDFNVFHYYDGEWDCGQWYYILYPNHSFGVVMGVQSLITLCFLLVSPYFRHQFYETREELLCLLMAFSVINTSFFVLAFDFLHIYLPWTYMVDYYGFYPSFLLIANMLGIEPFWDSPQAWHTVPWEWLEDNYGDFWEEVLPYPIYPDCGPDEGCAFDHRYSDQWFSANDVYQYKYKYRYAKKNMILDIKEFHARFLMFMGYSYDDVYEPFPIPGQWWTTCPEIWNHRVQIRHINFLYQCSQSNTFLVDRPVPTWYGISSEKTALMAEQWAGEFPHTKDWWFLWSKSWRFELWEDPVW